MTDQSTQQTDAQAAPVAAPPDVSQIVDQRAKQTDAEGKASRLATLVATAAALIAAMMPFTAFINGRYSVEAEREKFFTQMRLNYLDRALDTTRDASYRESVIRFLLDTTEPSDPLYTWAQKQKKIADEVRRLRGELVKVDTGLQNLRSELREEQKGRSIDKSAASARERELLNRLKLMSEERAEIEQSLRAAESEKVPTIGAQEKVVSSSVTSSRQPEVKLEITSAKAEFVFEESAPALGGPASISLVGRGFGNEAGQVYIMDDPQGGRAGKALEITYWIDTSIVGTIYLNPRESSSVVYAKIIASDSRSAGPVHVQMGNRYAM